MKITLKQLRVFDAVASLGSLSKAAEALNITQSTASAALKELQLSMGRPPLFHRVGRRLQITSEGEQLQPMVRTLLLNAEHIERPRAGGALQGSISIGAVEISEELLPRLAAAFRKLHPGVSVTIICGQVYEIASLLTRFAIDAMITSSLTRAPGAVLTELYRERSVIVAAPDHVLAALPSPGFADLADADWCMPGRMTLSNHRMMEALRGHLANFTVALEVNSDAALREGVRAGCGIGCLPLSVVESDLANGTLVELRVDGLTRLRPTFLVHMANVERSPAARAFDDFIVRSLATGGTPPARQMSAG